ncbi:MAG TPA: YetF domain-containing protein [Gemmatimonadaceae bacterium]|nr:YetF domain-containing protein [Gemmatimonadaceae bacterium]
MHELWQTLTHADIGLAEKVGRTLVVYIFLLVGLRLGGKRELGMLNPFDLVVLLVLSNTLQNAIIGPDNSLLGGLIGASVLLALNYAVVKYLYRHPHLDRIVEGEALELVRDGRILEKNMHKELITVEELKSRARLQGIEDLRTVKCARIEVGGALTFVQAHPTSEESFDGEMRRRLERIERLLEGGLPARAK